MKLQELKSKAYALAEVETTQQLKAKYEEIKPLDMRRTASWETAISVIQKQKPEFEQWLENPPEEYKELFAEISEASQKYDEKSAEVKRLTRKVQLTADQLEELSTEYQSEANQIEKEVKRSKRISEHARRN